MKTAKVEGSTVGECLDDLIRRFPCLKPLLFNDKTGKLHSYLEIFVNKQSAYPDELVKLVKNGDELRIINIIMGG